MKQNHTDNNDNSALNGMDRRIERKKWPSKRIATYTAIACFALLLIYIVASGSGGSRLNVRAETLTVATVERGLFQEYVPVPGEVLPIKTVYLDAVEGGRVEEVFVEGGSYVKQGDPIMSLANTSLHLDIMYREAEVFQQINNLRNTRLAMEQNRLAISGNLLEIDYQVQTTDLEYKRSRQLREKNLISQQDFEQVENKHSYWLKRRDLTIETQRQDSILRTVQIEQLEASVARMENNLVIVKQRLENLLIRAPVAGQLTSLNAEVGESKRSGERLGQVDILDGFKVRASIDEYYISRIAPGQSGQFTLDDTDYRLTVSKVYPEVREGRFEIDLEFTGNEPQGIRRGQTLRVRLELGDQSETILLTRGGFYQETGGRWGYVLDKSGDIARKVDFKLGRMNPLSIEVLEGLDPGDRVVISSYDTFGDAEELVLE